MKNLFRFLILFALSTGAQAAFIQSTLTVTNIPNVGTNFSINAKLLTWTNASANATIQTNTISTGASATNLFRQLQSYQIPGIIQYMASSNSVVLIGGTNAITGNVVGWLNVSNYTNSGVQHWPLEVPRGALSATSQTFNASQIIDYLNNGNPTNTIATNSPAITNLVTLTTGQTISNKTAYGFVHGSGSISNVNANITNLVASNAVIVNLRMTNGTNYGRAFSSPGTSPLSEQFGTGATANTNALAVGRTATASGKASTAIGTAVASALSSLALGDSTIAAGESSAAIGASSYASETNSTAVGTAAYATHFRSTAIGVEAQTTVNKQIRLGTATEIASVPGNLNVELGITNGTHTGTNTLTGQWLIPKSIVTFSDTNNVVDPSDKTFIDITGPSVPFNVIGILGGREGREITFRNKTGFSIRFSNLDGGTNPTNQLSLGTGIAGVSIVLTNQASFATFRFEGGITKWELMRQSN